LEFSLNKKNSYDGLEREKKKIENNFLDFSLNKTTSPKNIIVNNHLSIQNKNDKAILGKFGNEKFIKVPEKFSDIAYLITKDIKENIKKEKEKDKDVEKDYNDNNRKFSNNTTGNMKNKKILNLKDLISLDGNNNLTNLEKDKKIEIKDNNNNLKKKLNLNDILNSDKQYVHNFFNFYL